MSVLTGDRYTTSSSSDWVEISKLPLIPCERPLCADRRSEVSDFPGLLCSAAQSRRVEVKHALWPDVWNPRSPQQNNRRVEIELSKHPLGAAHCVFEKVGWPCRTQRCSRKRPPLVALFAFTIIVRPSPRRFLWPLDRFLSVFSRLQPQRSATLV